MKKYLTDICDKCYLWDDDYGCQSLDFGVEDCPEEEELNGEKEI